MEEDRQARIYGVRPARTFEQAAAKFVLEHQHKRSLEDDVGRLKGLLPWIGHIALDKVSMGALQPWIAHRRKARVAMDTINHGLQVVRRIMNLAASEWIDGQGLTWIQSPAKIKLLPNRDKRLPYPLNWDEQTRLLRELPEYLAEMALFAVNTGCRDGEICNLLWDWEVVVPELNISVFIVPGWRVKNGDERLVILNRVAMSIVNSRRGKHATHVFAYNGHPLSYMLNRAWRTARVRAGLAHVRVHAAGMSFEDRQDLLGHRSGRITTHYSAAELSRLIDAANRVCDRDDLRPELVVLRGSVRRGDRKMPAMLKAERENIPSSR
jgi:integrase